MHTLRKLGSTIKILATLGMARMFGKYEYSGYDGTIHYARYLWRGRWWIIPTSPVDTSIGEHLTGRPKR